MSLQVNAISMRPLFNAIKLFITIILAKGTMLKIDLHKAYDSMICDPLQKLLEAYSFLTIIINACIYTLACLFHTTE